MRQPEARRRILHFVKSRDTVFVDEVARRFRTSHEGARKHLVALEREGWVARRKVVGGVGRPRDVYAVTPAGDRQLPKAYDRLSLQILTGLRGSTGAVRRLLSGLTRAQIETWRPRTAGLPLRKKLERLRGIYQDADPFTSVESRSGQLLLVERNCPFLSVALEFPALCSLTVNTLEGLVGHPVERVERFQHGHGRCVFRVRADLPLPEARFRFESEKTRGADRPSEALPS